MGKHLKLFSTRAQYEAFCRGNEYIEPHVSLCMDDNKINYNKKESSQQKIKALKFSSPDECELYVNVFDEFDEGCGYMTANSQYSFDANEWIDWDGNNLSFGNGTDLYIRGNNPNGWSTTEYEVNAFIIDGNNVTVEGNIMYLLSYEEDLKTIPCNKCFERLFHRSNIIDASKLELPATTLADDCYCRMFENCESLVNAPALPATILADYCYGMMFYGCTSLMNAPALPATTLTCGCYSSMFEYCSNLNHIKMTATDISEDYVLNRWVSDVSSTGTFECAQGMSTVIPRGADGIPDGWTVAEVTA